MRRIHWHVRYHHLCDDSLERIGCKKKENIQVQILKVWQITETLQTKKKWKEIPGNYIIKLVNIMRTACKANTGYLKEIQI